MLSLKNIFLLNLKKERGDKGAANKLASIIVSSIKKL